MRLHHIGVACTNLDEGVEALRALYTVERVVGPVLDSGQGARVCLLETAHGVRFELAAGPAVEGLLARGIRQYHTCFVVDDLATEAARLREAGAMPLSEPKPARLFGGARVLFLMTKAGLIELLEQRE